MTAASQPDGLDALLAAQGYEIDAPTSVQLMDLGALDDASVASTALDTVPTVYRPSSIVGGPSSVVRRPSPSPTSPSTQP